MYTLSFLLLFAAVSSVWNVEVIPERANIKYINEKYVTDVKFYIRRYSRRSPYYINLEAQIKHEWNNNVSFHFYFYEFLHNEYKRSFVELHYNELCNWLLKSTYIGHAVRKSACADYEKKRREGLQSKSNDNCGDDGLFKCPVPAGFYKLHNMSIPMADFPNVWPFERCRVDVVALDTPSDVIMAEIQAFVFFKQKLGK